jgi:protein TonB
MLVVIGAHVAVIAAVMSAKMDLPRIIRDPPLVIDLIEPTPPPPPNPIEQPRQPQTQHQQSVIDQPPVIIPTPPTAGETVDSRPTPLPPIDQIIGPAVDPLPPVPTPKPMPVIKAPARLLTSGEALKPPYPGSKIASGEEAVLQLRLSISENGRVVAVEPVGRADPAFLEAARRHLLRSWRFKAASEDGRAVASTTVITLRFQLDG